MCGICGIFSLSEPVNGQTIVRMRDVMQHRGPDDAGLYLSDTIGLGHRRLAIIDLSPSGHQPMSNEDKTIWLVFNGEIYNYLELRAYLKAKGHTFASQTDTEVVIHAYEEWEEECLQRFNGMFAFAIWDQRNQRLFCARDRFGIKPFYYHWDGSRFRFASEIKALLEDSSIEKAVNENAVYGYLAFGKLEDGVDTFFTGIMRLLPAHYLIVGPQGLKIQRYWDLTPEDMQVTCDNNPDSRYATQFYELLEDSVRLRLRSDVPVGTCLSGGLDSSSIVCIANKLMFPSDKRDYSEIGARQKTFSACWEHSQYDEREFIEEILGKTGAERNFTFPSPDELFDVIEDIIWHHDEPFRAIDIFAQWQVMKLAQAKGIKVLLDGIGGDELLAGYIGYYHTYLFLDLLTHFQFKELATEILAYTALNSVKIHWIMKDIVKVIYAQLPLYARLKHRISKLSWLAPDFVAAYQPQSQTGYNTTTKYSSQFAEALYRRLTTSLGGTGLPVLLRYEDRDSMAFSIEARVPFLDHRLVEFVFSLPASQKIRHGVTKVILRNAMKGILPEKVRLRMDKIGFSAPSSLWLRTILRDKVKDIIHSDSFRQRGYFRVDEVERQFALHCSGKKNVTAIWRWINLELWLRIFFRS